MRMRYGATPRCGRTSPRPCQHCTGLAPHNARLSIVSHHTAPAHHYARAAPHQYQYGIVSHRTRTPQCPYTHCVAPAPIAFVYTRRHTVPVSVQYCVHTAQHPYPHWATPRHTRIVPRPHQRCIAPAAHRNRICTTPQRAISAPHRTRAPSVLCPRSTALVSVVGPFGRASGGAYFADKCVSILVSVLPPYLRMSKS